MKFDPQAFAWSSESIGRARELFGDAAFTGRSLTMSSAYSGIGTIEQSSHQICHNLSSTSGCGPHTIHSTWALEKDEVCKAELVSYFDELGGDTCVFGNLKELIPESWWPDLGFGPTADELTPTQLYAKRLHHATLVLESRACAAHTGCNCKLGQSDLHIAGTTCVDHSSYGSCTGDEGRNVIVFFFLIWAALMRQLLPPIIIHENVTGFGTGALQEVFGDVYVVCGSNACSSLMGYPIRRKRQMCILVLKRWIYPQLRAAGMSTSCNPVDVQHLVNLQATLDALSARPCHLSFTDFIVATPEEQHAEIREAARRRGWFDVGHRQPRAAQPTRTRQARRAGSSRATVAVLCWRLCCQWSGNASSLCCGRNIPAQTSLMCPKTQASEPGPSSGARLPS